MVTNKDRDISQLEGSTNSKRLRKEHVHLPSGSSTTLHHNTSAISESLRQIIQNVTIDERDLYEFYNISFSRTRVQRLGEYYAQRQNQLVTGFRSSWDSLDADAKVDWLLSRAYLKRQSDGLRSAWDQISDLEPLLASWAHLLVEICEKRQRVDRLDAKDGAQVLSDSRQAIDALAASISAGKLKPAVSKFTAYRAANAIQELQSHLMEWYGFYATYDPMFDWWVKKEWEQFPSKLDDLVATIKENLVGIKPNENDAIVGQPSGRESILADLQAEVIPYSPEEIIKIGETEYDWCEKEMIKASKDLGYGKHWLNALEHVKTLHVEPGQQIYLVQELAQEAVEYVTEHDMVTIPPIANEAWKTIMMSPAAQKVNPFFLGGTLIQVSYPTNSMSHSDKVMIMRGNNRYFSRSTVFHELLPGHHLQYYYMDRYKPYRRIFTTPFWIEGWSFYWEMILWDRGFAATPEDKIGMLFWRMHRALRIIFSLKFHLGQMTPQECIDVLVEKGGHERATAEGEMRRSFNGEYSPLYQAGYMLGALQFYALRKEIVDNGTMSEKDYHDRILRMNQMPIEMVRALLKGKHLSWDHKPSWKFYAGAQKESTQT